MLQGEDREWTRWSGRKRGAGDESSRLLESSRRVAGLVARAVLLLLLVGCATTRNYTDPNLPRYVGAPLRGPLPDPDPEVRVVTFNVEHAWRIPEATRLLRTHPDLVGADIIFLQEMDLAGTRAVADSLSMYWVYYPASVSPATNRDFGNAILARWPLHHDRKLILPHLALVRRSQRIATACTVEIEGRSVQLYSAHLALPVLVSRSGRREQARTIVRDASWHPGPAIVGGDFNAQGVGEVLEEDGFSWPTRGLGHTTRIFAVDHIFARGFDFAADPSAGAVDENGGASDHRPVWAVLRPVDRDPIPSVPWRFARREPGLGIENAAYIEPDLVRGAWPGEAGLTRLRDQGFRTIINLTGDGGERNEAEGLGFDYFEIPLTATLWSSPPSEDQVARFLDLVQDPSRRPLYFHCKKGKDRTGTMAALYRIEAHGWTNGEAIEEMQAFGYHDWFEDLIQYVRTYVPRRSR